MFGIGMPELIIILVIILIIFGAGKLPEIGAGMGKAIKSFKSATAAVIASRSSPCTIKATLGSLSFSVDLNSISSASGISPMYSVSNLVASSVLIALCS